MTTAALETLEQEHVICSNGNLSDASNMQVDDFGDFGNIDDSFDQR